MCESWLSTTHTNCRRSHTFMYKYQPACQESSYLYCDHEVLKRNTCAWHNVCAGNPNVWGNPHISNNFSHKSHCMHLIHISQFMPTSVLLTGNGQWKLSQAQSVVTCVRLVQSLNNFYSTMQDVAFSQPFLKHQICMPNAWIQLSSQLSIWSVKACDSSKKSTCTLHRWCLAVLIQQCVYFSINKMCT